LHVNVKSFCRALRTGPGRRLELQQRADQAEATAAEKTREAEALRTTLRLVAGTTGERIPPELEAAMAIRQPGGSVVHLTVAGREVIAVVDGDSPAEIWAAIYQRVTRQAS
jgi:threonine dehydrogenase-like Zn-dependent dehydrogenase